MIDKKGKKNFLAVIRYQSKIRFFPHSRARSKKYVHFLKIVSTGFQIKWKISKIIVDDIKHLRFGG